MFEGIGECGLGAGEPARQNREQIKVPGRVDTGSLGDVQGQSEVGGTADPDQRAVGLLDEPAHQMESQALRRNNDDQGPREVLAAAKLTQPLQGLPEEDGFSPTGTVSRPERYGGEEVGAHQP